MGKFKVFFVALYIVLFFSSLSEAYPNPFRGMNFFWNQTEEIRKQNLEYVLPIVDRVVESNKDYWTPVFDNTIDYWSPILDHTIASNQDFWSEKLEEGRIKFLNDIHPILIKSYNFYYEHGGRALQEEIVNRVNTNGRLAKRDLRQYQDYLFNQKPNTYYFLADIPAPVKKAYEQFIHGIWKTMETMDQKELMSAAGDKRLMVEMALSGAKSMDQILKTEEGRKLNHVLDQVREHGRDKGMKDCYQVVYVEHEVMNAFNIGCNIFVTDTLYNALEGNEDYLRAVIAHEMAHGELGHGMKTFLGLIATHAKHYSNLVFEEFLWVISGKQSEYLDEVVKHGVVDLAMQDFFSQAPEIEMQADYMAAKILERAGYKAKDLIDALRLLMSEKEEGMCEDFQGNQSTGRHYPDFCQRRDVILEASR